MGSSPGLDIDHASRAFLCPFLHRRAAEKPEAWHCGQWVCSRGSRAENDEPKGGIYVAEQDNKHGEREESAAGEAPTATLVPAILGESFDHLFGCLCS